MLLSRERTKGGALLHGVPYGVPQWSAPKNHLLVKLNTISTYHIISSFPTVRCSSRVGGHLGIL